jgi:hypothetical protein
LRRKESEIESIKILQGILLLIKARKWVALVRQGRSREYFIIVLR